MANTFIEKLRGRVPYIRRLHARIDDLQHRLAGLEAVPALHPPYGSDSPQIVAQFRAFLRLLQPHDAAKVAKRRFGADHDGGYVMLDDFGEARTALSFGIGPDVSWDAEMANRGLRVMQFDHTVERPPQDNPRFDFHRSRVVGQKQMPDDVTLAEILGQPGLAGDNELIAKIDVEGCEWEILAETPVALLLRLRQVAIEFHDVRQFVERPWRVTALSALQNLTASHVCVHVHGNNWGPFVVIGGIPFPSAFEASFARRSDYAFTPSPAEFPTELDRPCNPKMPDLYLGRWDY